MPGMRPPMGGAPHLVSAPPGAGGMGILMPIYTIGIIIFFVYTMMKVISIYYSFNHPFILHYFYWQIMFKKRPEDDEIDPRNPMLKDFHMDPEHRKYLFAETYCSAVPGSSEADMSVKQYAMLMEQQQRLAMEQRFAASAPQPNNFANKDGIL